MIKLKIRAIIYFATLKGQPQLMIFLMYAKMKIWFSFIKLKKIYVCL